MLPADPRPPGSEPVRGPAPSSGPAAERRAGARRADILGVIKASRQGLGIRALAEATGLHENTVRFHLDRLVQDGMVERRTGLSQGPGRPPLTFVARRDHHGAGHDNYELLARVLTEHLGGTDDVVGLAEAAGRSWGLSRVAPPPGPAIPGPQGPALEAWDAALDELTRVLDGAGFAPEVTTETGEAATVRVHNCPFLSLAREDRAVPCAVHLGLMEGVLEAAGSGTVERLEPFVTPSLCVARVRAGAGR